MIGILLHLFVFSGPDIAKQFLNWLDDHGIDYSLMKYIGGDGTALNTGPVVGLKINFPNYRVLCFL